MPEFKTKRSLYRTRTVRSITRTMQPIVSKHFIDFQAEEADSSHGKTNVGRQRKTLRTTETVLDRIINKLKKDYRPEDILLMITPASKHANLYKLHIIQRHKPGHLGMTTITHKELSRLKASHALHKYCIVFGSRYMDLKTVVLQTETIKSLVNNFNRKCCGESEESQLPQKNSLSANKSNTSSAGDYLNAETVGTIKYQDSFIQTDPEFAVNTSFTLSDILRLIETIHQTLQPCKKDIDRFFLMADKLKFSLVVRPELLWKTPAVNNKSQENCVNFHLESYMPGNCYLGSITLLANDLLEQMDLYPKILFNTHVIEDVFEITPVPKMLVEILKTVLGFLKLELFYDALGELIFDWCKSFTFL